MELLERARRGDLEVVKRLLQQRVNVNAKNLYQQTALYCACEGGHTAVAQCLLRSGASVSIGVKPLIAAVRFNHYDCVKLLLQYNAYVNCTNMKRESPMSIALQKRHYPIILLLLQHGAIPCAPLRDIEIQLLTLARAEHVKAIQKLIDAKIINLLSERTFLAAFSFAFKYGSVRLAKRMLLNDSYSKIEQLYPKAAYYSAKNNWPTILSKLFEKGVDINEVTDGQTPLYVACKEGHESVVSLLLNNGADPNVPILTASASKVISLPLHIAVQHRNVTIFNMLLEKGAKVNHPEESLLHVACSAVTKLKTAGEAGKTRSVENMISIIRSLLQQEVNVDAISEKGDTALYRACVSEQLQVVQILLEAGADVNLTSKGFYPVMAACDAGNIDLINLLVKAGADATCRKSNNETCLHAIVNAYSSAVNLQKLKHGVSTLDIANTIKSLLESGVDVDARCSQEETALYRASIAGLEHIVRLLLEEGADANGLTSCGPLYAACERGYTPIVDLLLRHGADSNASSSGVPICRAVQERYTDIVELLLKHGADTYKQDPSGSYALIYFTKWLASQRCKTTQVSNPLDERNLNILKSMLNVGGDVNVLSKHGHNALHIASNAGMCDVMTELIRHGANCNHLTFRGNRALDVACKNGHELAVELLLKNGAKPDRDTAPTQSKLTRYDPCQKPMPPVLCLAAKHGSETMVKMLLQHGADVNTPDNKGDAALHLATSNAAIVATLLSAGANVNATNDNGDTALSLVCGERKADANVVEMLLKFGADPNVGFLLHTACENNDPDTVRLLLAYGADANRVKKSVSQRTEAVHMQHIEPTPLYIACKNGNTAIVDSLLQKGADVNFADSDGKCLLHFAIERPGKQANSEEYDPIVKLLLQHNAIVDVVSNTGETPLYVACSEGLTGVVKQLLDCSADVGLTTSISNKCPLLIACQRKGNIAMMLLERGADPNVEKDYQTPLKLAAANGDAILVKQLLTYGANVNQMQNVSHTALHIAIDKCKSTLNEVYVKTVQVLLKSGADINVLNHRGETPLYVACRPTGDAYVDVVRILLEHGADPNISPYQQYLSPSSRYRALPPRYHVLSPLSSAASCGNSELVALLIKFGARLDHGDQFGGTALHFAIGYEETRFVRCLKLESTMCDISTAEILLSAGADANVLDTSGASPLFLACDRGKTEFVKLLLSRGANPNIGSAEKYPLLAACRGHHYDSVKLMLECNTDVNVRDKDGSSALHYAVESECCPVSRSDTRTLVQLLREGGANVNATSGLVELLLKHGANVDVADIRGNTALHHAIEHYHGTTSSPYSSPRNPKAIIDVLLENKADVNIVNSSGETSLYRAVSRGLLDVFRELLQCGGNPNIGAPEKSPFAVCLTRYVELVDMLLKHGADPNTESIFYPYSRHKLPLFVAVEAGNCNVITLLLNAGADVNATNHEGKSVLCFAAENLTNKPGSFSSPYLPSIRTAEMIVYLSIIRLLLQHGANVNMLLPDGDSPLYFVLRILARGCTYWDRKCSIELLQLMVENGAMLLDSFSEREDDVSRQLSNSGTLRALATFDNKDGFIVDLFRAGAGFQLIASFCNAVAATCRKAKSIRLCQAAVLAGYTPSAEELQSLRRAAASDGVLDQLVNWLNEDRQQVPSLFRQCRVAIRRQLSVDVNYQTILPAIDQLSLPDVVESYLKFDGVLTEVDLSVKQ